MAIRPSSYSILNNTDARMGMSVLINIAVGNISYHEVIFNIFAKRKYFIFLRAAVKTYRRHSDGRIFCRKI